MTARAGSNTGILTTCERHFVVVKCCAARYDGPTQILTQHCEVSAVMRIDAIPVGANPPYDVNVIVEVPRGGVPVKYEMDKASGAMFVDRFLHTAMHYPCNYGFVPHTLSDDGDPVDVLVAGADPVVPGAVVRTRPVGVLFMKDEAGDDEKILGVPVDALSPFYEDVSSYRDLPRLLINRIEHFFDHYKDLEDKKWVEIVRWGGPEEAMELIRSGIEAVKGTSAE